MTLKEFFAKLGLDLDDASFEKAEAAIEGVKTGLLALSAAAAAGAAALGVMIGETIDRASEIKKLAQLAGTDVESIQKLEYAAARAGVSIEDLKGLVAELSENIGEAAGGTGEAAEAFKSLGIKTKDSKGNLRDHNEILLEIADKMAAMPDGTKKTAALMGLFGEEGTKLLPILNQGSAGIKELGVEAEELGLIMDKATVAAGVETGASFKRLWMILRAVREEIAGAFLQDIQELIAGFIEWYKANRAILALRLKQFFRGLVTVLKALVAVLRILGKVVFFIVDHFEIFLVVVGALSAALIFLKAEAIASAILGFIAMGKTAVVTGLAGAAAWGLLLLKVIAIAAAFALVILIWEDLYTWWVGGESLIARLWESWTSFLDDFLTPGAEDPWWMLLLKTWASWLRSFWGTVGSALLKAKDLFIEFNSWLFSLLDGVYQYLYDSLVGPIQDALSLLPGLGIGHSSAGVTGSTMIVDSVARRFGGGASLGDSVSSNAQRIDYKTISPSLNVGEIKVTPAPGMNTADLAKKVREEVLDLFTDMARLTQDGVEE